MPQSVIHSLTWRSVGELNSWHSLSLCFCLCQSVPRFPYRPSKLTGTTLPSSVSNERHGLSVLQRDSHFGLCGTPATGTTTPRSTSRWLRHGTRRWRRQRPRRRNHDLHPRPTTSADALATLPVAASQWQRERGGGAEPGGVPQQGRADAADPQKAAEEVGEARLEGILGDFFGFSQEGRKYHFGHDDESGE